MIGGHACLRPLGLHCPWHGSEEMRALLVIDMQVDFIDGSLAVPGAEAIIPLVLKRIRLPTYDYLVFTRDAHPSGHTSFASRYNKEPLSPIEVYGAGGHIVQVDTLWPDHCVVGTNGYEFHQSIRPVAKLADLIVEKGTKTDEDAYSGFSDTKLEQWLRNHKVDEVEVVGLAFDYCVKATALDSAKAGFTTMVTKGATASVFPENDSQIVRELENSGVIVK